jgi:hypothetical protein
VFFNFSKCYIVMDLLEGPVLLDALLEMGKYTEVDTKVHHVPSFLARVAHANAHLDLGTRPFALGAPRSNPKL